jgi:hypothetical protein
MLFSHEKLEHLFNDIVIITQQSPKKAKKNPKKAKKKPKKTLTKSKRINMKH